MKIEKEWNKNWKRTEEEQTRNEEELNRDGFRIKVERNEKKRYKNEMRT